MKRRIVLALLLLLGLSMAGTPGEAVSVCWIGPGPVYNPNGTACVGTYNDPEGVVWVETRFDRAVVFTTGGTVVPAHGYSGVFLSAGYYWTSLKGRKGACVAISYGCEQHSFTICPVNEPQPGMEVCIFPEPVPPIP